MTVVCQFCQLLLPGPVVAEDATPAGVRHAYNLLSWLVATHMSMEHREDAGREIDAAIKAAGAAVAMRYVESNDARIDAERIAAGDRLCAAFAPAPIVPLLSLATAKTAA